MVDAYRSETINLVLEEEAVERLLDIFESFDFEDDQEFVDELADTLRNAV